MLYKRPKNISVQEAFKPEPLYLELLKGSGNLRHSRNSLCTEMHSVSGRSPPNEVSGPLTLTSACHAGLCLFLPSLKPRTHNSRASVLQATAPSQPRSIWNA